MFEITIRFVAGGSVTLDGPHGFIDRYIKGIWKDGMLTNPRIPVSGYTVRKLD